MRWGHGPKWARKVTGVGNAWGWAWIGPQTTRNLLTGALLSPSERFGVANYPKGGGGA